MRPERLTPTAGDLTARSLDWMDRLWDPAVGLLRAPDEPGDSRGAPVGHLVRETSWYALGLLMRDAQAVDGGEADLDRARHALGRVLDHQLDAPGTRFDGTWLRGPQESVPTPDSVEWRDYDPNWREFIGTALTIVVREFPEALDDALRSRVDVALRRAATGSFARGVGAAYTNIALMSVFLLEDAGARFGEPAWAERAVDLAGAVLARFRTTGAFDEYNAPTYYGINLYALALWRRYGDAELVRAGGAELEAALWRDTAAHYHAGLRNLAGPYDRSYGMDLRSYASGVGLWIWLATGPELAPFPALDQPFRHSWDLALAPLCAILGAVVPDDAVAHLESFRGARQLEQVIVHDPRRVATSWVGERLLVGAEDVGGERGGLGDQFHPATAHWLSGTGDAADVGWFRLVSDLAVDARADGPFLDLTCSVHDGGDLALAVQLRPPHVGAVDRTAGGDRSTVTGLAQRRWLLPGLDAAVETDAELVAVEPDPHDDTWWLRYVARDVPANRPISVRIALRTEA